MTPLLLVLALSACSILVDRGPGGATDATFPHPDGWDEGARLSLIHI